METDTNWKGDDARGKQKTYYFNTMLNHPSIQKLKLMGYCKVHYISTSTTRRNLTMLHVQVRKKNVHRWDLLVTIHLHFHNSLEIEWLSLTIH